MGTIDWASISNFVSGVGVIMLLLAPLFWWLYDTDRFVRWYGNGEIAWAIAAVLAFYTTVRNHDWLFVALWIVLICIAAWRWHRTGRIWPSIDDF